MSILYGGKLPRCHPTKLANHDGRDTWRSEEKEKSQYSRTDNTGNSGYDKRENTVIDITERKALENIATIRRIPGLSNIKHAIRAHRNLKPIKRP